MLIFVFPIRLELEIEKTEKNKDFEKTKLLVNKLSKGKGSGVVRVFGLRKTPYNKKVFHF